MANKLIPSNARTGKLLDIGCGSFPFFLTHTQFKEKYGLDRVIDDHQIVSFSEKDIQLINHDLERSTQLPFDDNTFDVVTKLAVFEHIPIDPLRELMREIYRVLKPGGSYILTTPAGWTDGILKTMASLHLLSQEEIHEHQDLFNNKKIRVILEKAGFQSDHIRQGSFELGMNLWAHAIK